MPNINTDLNSTDLQSIDFKNLARSVLSICQEAAEAILEVYNNQEDFGIETKTDDSPVTKADIAANKIIEARLKELNLKLPILTEESAAASYEQRQGWSRYWLVDPLDGTKEFIKRNDQFTINIALIENNKPRLGVVYVPVTHIAYVGVLGEGSSEGAFKLDASETQEIFTAQQKIQCRKLSSTKHVDVVASINHSNPATDAIVEKLETHIAPIARKAIGSSLKFCLLAEGLADVYPRMAPTSEWDTGAAQAVLEAAGGAVYTLNSRPLDLKPLGYNTKESLLNPSFIALADPDYDWSFLESVALETSNEQ